MSSLLRWSSFLGQLQDRARQVRDDASRTARALIEELAGSHDSAPLSRLWSAAESRLQELETRVDETWHDKVEAAIEAEGLGVAERDHAYVLGLRMRRELEDARDELGIALFAELARRRHAWATAAPRTAPCRRCGHGLDVPHHFDAVTLVCAACGATTSVEPSDAMRAVAAVAAHALAQEAALTEWRAMRAAERRIHDTRPPRPLELIVAHEQAQIAYWRRYLATRAWFEPVLARDPALEVRSRMEAWYRSVAEYEEAWVRAGRPRAAI